MSDSIPTLSETASAVSALGSCQAQIDRLDDASLQGAMRLVREHEQVLQKYKLWLAAAIARRSDHTLGYGGLARRNGFPTPAVFIQAVIGSSIEEATRLARLGQSMVDADLSGSELSPVVVAVVAGGISVDAADAIRRGLGKADPAVGEAELRRAAENLIAHAQSVGIVGGVTPEALLKLARQARQELDLAAVERGEKTRAATRYVRIWSRDGMSGGSWCLPDEDGGVEINTALKLLLAKANGGPRFADPSLPRQNDVVEDTRPPEHILADGFAQIVHNGITTNRTIPGVGRAAVQVIVEERVLLEREGSALLEETLSAISFGKLEEYLCEGGTIQVRFNDDGTMNLGREQRLYTGRQRRALAVRDGGCRFPGCDKPPSWTEAHHIAYWARDVGRTDLENGMLLCRYHHMLMHTGGWDITRDVDRSPGGDFWLQPPRERDSKQRLIPMPSKNPLVEAMHHVQTTSVG